MKKFSLLLVSVLSMAVLGACSYLTGDSIDVIHEGGETDEVVSNGENVLPFSSWHEGLPPISPGPTSYWVPDGNGGGEGKWSTLQGTKITLKDEVLNFSLEGGTQETWFEVVCYDPFIINSIIVGGDIEKWLTARSSWESEEAGVTVYEQNNLLDSNMIFHPEEFLFLEAPGIKVQIKDYSHVVVDVDPSEEPRSFLVRIYSPYDIWNDINYLWIYQQ